jgi:hypothetical protein
MVWGLALPIFGVIAIQIGVSRLVDGTLRDIERGDYSVARIQALNLFGMDARMCRRRGSASGEGVDHLAVAYRQAFGTTIEESCPGILD